MVWAAAGNLPGQNKNNECVNRPPETAVKKYASTYDLPCTNKLLRLYCHIHMYRTLTDPKLFRCLPHRRIILYYIYGNLHGPLLNIILQKNPPANIVFTMYAGGLKVIQRRVRFPDSATYGPVYYNSRLLSFSRKSYNIHPASHSPHLSPQ